MDNNNNPTATSGQGNNFFNGFLLGALVGAAVVFLLGTKKGKKLLKAISEEGIENISNLLDEANRSVDLDEVIEEPSFASRDKKAAFFAPLSGATKAESEEQGEDFAQERGFAIKEKTIEKPRVRRFFRGISKHVN